MKPRARGVKGRIIRLYDKLADEVVDAAKGPSVNLLTKEFKKVEEEILQFFKKNKSQNDPVGTAADHILQKHKADFLKKDKKRREKVLDKIKTIRSHQPTEFENN